MERNERESKPRDYLNRTPTYRWTRGEFRIGADCQIVCNETHRTLASSNGAHDWISENAHRDDRDRATRATRPPDAKPISPINDITQRRNIYR
jgi:hypothetical protein